MKLYLPHGLNESQDETYLQPSLLNSEAVYEGFSPSSFHRISNFDLHALKGGEFVLTVGDSPQVEAYGLIFGYVESYSIWEWIRLPFDLISIYRWEGQSYLQVFAPPLLVLIFGFPLVVMKIGRWNMKAVIRSWMPAAGGLLVLGTASITIAQMLYVPHHAGPSAEMGITIFILSAQILIGLLLLRTGISQSSQGGTAPS